MKLIRLKLNTDFRSLKKGFEISFFSNSFKGSAYEFMPYCLVGKNGSGKSNILEALAAIFYHLECIYLDYKPEGFEIDEELKSSQTKGFRAERCVPDAFELEYRIPVKWKTVTKTWNELKNQTWNETAHISITKKINEPPKVVCLNKKLFEVSDVYKVEDKTKRETNELSRTGVKDILPDFVIGYSSGENEILSLPFLKMRFINYDEYEDVLRRGDPYTKPEGRLVYFDNQYSQAVFLTNYLMQSEEVLGLIHKAIGIKSIKQFRIIIRQGVPIAKFRPEDSSPALNPEDLEIDNESVFDLTYNLFQRKETSLKEIKAIDKLKNCATSQFFDTENKTLYLDYFIDEDIKDKKGNVIQIGEMKKAFRQNFENAFDLFHTFQTLFTLNLFEVDRQLKIDLYSSESLYVNETIPILASDKRIMRFKDFIIEKENVADEILSKSLSDGEHQYLHAIGICLLYKHTNSLFLFDEPETHFNPEWRAEFISTLKNCLENDQKSKNNLRELLITTHSPFIVSDSKKENVLVFKKAKSGKVSCRRPNINTYGASINQITMSVFEKRETISDIVVDKLNSIKNSFVRGKLSKDEALKAANVFGDSVEKYLLVDLIENYKKKPLKKR